MNKLGIAFTFIILFMSVAFLTVAIMVGASHKEWKEQAAENKRAADRLQTLVNEIKKTANEKDKKLAAEKVSRATMIANLQNQVITLEKQVDDKERLLTEEEVRSRQRLEVMQQSEARVQQQDQQITGLLEENRVYAENISTTRTSVVNLTNLLNETEGQLRRKEQLAEDMQGQLANQARVLDANGLTENSLTDHIVPPLDGVVTQTADNVVVVSLGMDDGLRSGHVVHIYRGDRFVARATVKITEHNFSSVLIQPEFTNVSVLEGDLVTTKF